MIDFYIISTTLAVNRIWVPSLEKRDWSVFQGLPFMHHHTSRSETTSRRTTILAALVLMLGVITLLPSKPASALTINRNFFGGLAPSTVGGGSIVDIFNTAADWWEASILDDHTLNIDFGWSDLPGNILATASTSDSIRISNGTVRFDNTRSDWFLDATPDDSVEYQNFTETNQDLGGGVVNTSREFGAFFGDAFSNFDLLTVAAHEIGHLLGVLDLFGNPMPDPLLITGPRPFAGTSLDTVPLGGGHLSQFSYPSTVMNPFTSPSVRRHLSAIDILAAAERSDFTELNLNPLAPPIAVAEPAPLAILSFGLLASLALRRRKARAT